ncbi:MAG: sulfatase [Fulvivirga sp.]
MKLSYLLRLVTCCILCLGAGCGDQEKGSKNRPNIVFLFADDWGKYASIYDKYEKGHKINSVIETPNFDRIARDGALFLNAFVPAPSCTPCRSSILSGQYFYRTEMGAILHGAQWDPTIPSYPLLLEENGYHIGYTYKVWSPGTPVDAPYGGKRVQYQSAGNNFNRFSQTVMPADDRAAAKDSLFKEVADNFKSFLSDNKQDAPYCYWFGPTNTHRSWVKGSGKELWGLDPDNLKGKLPTFLNDNAEIREDFNDYLGEVKAWDRAVGVILGILEERGELDNTLMVISGDHGIPGFPRAKTNLYDFGTEVALAMYWPDHIKKGTVINDLVNLMDLAPTFLEVGNTPIPEVMTGNSLVPLLKNGTGKIKRDFVVTGRERHVAQARSKNLPYPQRAFRTADYLYIRNLTPDRWPIGTLKNGLRDIDDGPTKAWYIKKYDSIKDLQIWDIAFGKRPYEELYAIRKDPYQVNNLASKEKYSEIKCLLSKQLDSVLMTTGDPRMTKDPGYFDRMPFTGINNANSDQHTKISQQVNHLYQQHRKEHQ